MPYIIKKVNKGFKVCKTSQPKKCFSNKPITKKQAIKQKIAIILNSNFI